MKRMVFLALVLFACQNEPATPPAPPMKEGAPPMPMTTSPTSTVTAEPPKRLTGFQTPASVLWDPDQDVYFVSNVNGEPTVADDNGFISRINPDTLQIDLKWIDAAKPDILLNAPKGLGILGDDLYVADLTVVRKFNRKTGKPAGEIKIPGSTFLNDIASDGKAVYVTDSGLKAGASGFDSTGTDAVWRVVNDKPEKIASGSDLSRPNGVDIAADGKIWVVSFGSNELYQINNGKKSSVAKLPKGSLDGLVHLADGSFLVSSWEGKAVYRGKGNSFQTVVDGIESPADIGYDTKRHRLLIPHFTENVVTIHDVQ